VSSRLGFAVKVLGDGGLSSHDTRRWQSGPHLSVSLERLGAIFDYLEAKDVRMYRMASGLVPYGSHPEMDRFHGQVEECGAALAALGARARAADLRLSFHPGQYAVLNSEDEGVRAAAAADVELQASVLEAMGLGPEAVVVLHVGGVEALKRALATWPADQVPKIHYSSLALRSRSGRRRTDGGRPDAGGEGEGPGPAPAAWATRRVWLRLARRSYRAEPAKVLSRQLLKRRLLRSEWPGDHASESLGQRRVGGRVDQADIV
jgi:hypothetical protein